MLAEQSFSLPVVGLMLAILAIALLAGGILITLILYRKFGALVAVGFVIAVLMIPPALSFVFYVTLGPTATSAARVSPVTIPRDRSVDWGDAVTPTRDSADVSVAEGEISGPSVPEDLFGFQVDAQSTAVAAWSTSELDEFQANLYPGLIECATPLARQVGDGIMNEHVSPKGDEDQSGQGMTLVVYSWKSRTTERERYDEMERFMVMFADSLQQKFSNAEVVLIRDSHAAPSEDDYPDGAFLMRIDSKMSINMQPPWGGSRPETSGDVKCHIRRSGRSSVAELKFISKPWVDGLDQIVSEQPDRDFFVGYSDRLASSEPQARQSAMKNAQSKIRIAAGNRVNTLIDDSSVVDRFAQKLSRPGGSVWREAVLVDITGEVMRGNAEIAMAKATYLTLNKQGNALAALVLVLLTIAICFVANSLTGGYSRHPDPGTSRSAILLGFVAATSFASKVL